MDELGKLIIFIQTLFEKVSDSWKNNEKYQILNMKTNRVENIYYDKKLLLYVFEYRNFINEITINVPKDIQNLNLSNNVITRVKALNSIQQKIEKYENRAENGKIPLKKCLNDIFGARIILKNKIVYEEIVKYIKTNFPTLKCITAFREKYKAIHVYFGNNDNMKFQWELQIWNTEDENVNLISHAKYKQDYIKWENKNK